MARLAGKVAVITGGASGIGAATVRRFVDEGASVVVADLLDAEGKRLVETDPRRIAFAHCDVSNEDEVRGAIQLALDLHGRLDCLFNNAGYGGVDGPIDSIPLDGYERTMAVLARGVFLGMKHAAAAMKRQGRGSIINTASVAGLRAGFGSHVYSAAKAAVVHLTRSVAMELGEHGVRVNCICPGGIATPIFARHFGLEGEAVTASVATLREALASLHPIPRAGEPEDIANAALFLASDESSFVNGHALVVDGGLTGGQKWSQSHALFGGLKGLLTGGGTEGA